MSRLSGIHQRRVSVDGRSVPDQRCWIGRSVGRRRRRRDRDSVCVKNPVKDTKIGNKLLSIYNIFSGAPRDDDCRQFNI